jgi:hypothetical protein
VSGLGLLPEPGAQVAWLQLQQVHSRPAGAGLRCRLLPVAALRTKPTWVWCCGCCCCCCRCCHSAAGCPHTCASQPTSAAHLVACRHLLPAQQLPQQCLHRQPPYLLSNLSRPLATTCTHLSDMLLSRCAHIKHSAGPQNTYVRGMQPVMLCGDGRPAQEARDAPHWTARLSQQARFVAAPAEQGSSIPIRLTRWYASHKLTQLPTAGMGRGALMRDLDRRYRRFVGCWRMCCRDATTQGGCTLPYRSSCSSTRATGSDSCNQKNHHTQCGISAASHAACLVVVLEQLCSSQDVP